MRFNAYFRIVSRMREKLIFPNYRQRKQDMYVDFPFLWFLIVIICFSSLLQGRQTNRLIPVTVKQISEADHSGDEKSNFVINGVEAANVCYLYCC